MDRATSWMNSQRQELDNEQMAYERLVKKLDVVEDEIYQGQISSQHKLEEAREFWYSDHEMRYCIEELQTKQNAILHELSHIQDERKNDFRRLQLKWMDREEEIRQEYGKRLEKMNE